MFHRVRSETPKEGQLKDETTTEESVEAVEEGVDADESEDEQLEENVELAEDTEEEQAEDAEDAAPAAYTPPSSSPYTRSSSAGYPGAGAYAAPNTTPSYTPATSAPRMSAPADTSNAAPRELTIGAGITMSGEIAACDSLVVEGTVEAALEGASSLEITETGTFFGAVDIQDATIAGRFEGELTVHGRLVLQAGGVITGSVSYGELEVEAGALIDGRMTPIAAGQGAAASPRTQGSASKPVARVGGVAGGSRAANQQSTSYAAEA